MSHSRQPEPLDELRELIHALHDDRITPEDKARLEDWVCRDKEARRVYVGYMYLYAWLQWDHRRRAPTIAASSPPIAASSAAAPLLDLFGDVFRSGMGFLSRSFVMTLLMAIGLPAIVIVLLVVDLAHQPVATTPPAVAWIGRSHQCVWEDADAGATLGGRLIAGQELRLRSGLVEVAFLDGATVIVRGPAVFCVDGDGAGQLSAGSVAATVPPAAKGFAIQTPSARIVDLGTEFGVLVATDGTSEAHVFKGQVEMTAQSTATNLAPAKSLLRVGQAARVRPSSPSRQPNIELIAVSAQQFVRQMPAAEPLKKGPLIVVADRHNGAAFNGAMDGSLTVKPTCTFDGETDPAPSDEAGLREGSIFYSDRPFRVVHVDEPLLGAEYVRVYNTDKERRAEVNCWYDVTLASDRQEVYLMVLVDDRFEKKDQQQALVDQAVSQFAKPGEFVDTGYGVTIVDMVGDRPLSAFGKMVPTCDKSGNPIKYMFGSTLRANLSYAIMATAQPPQTKPLQSTE